MDAAEPGQDMDYPAQQSIAYQVYSTAGVCLTLIVVFSLTRLLTKFLCFMFFSMTIACVAGSDVPPGDGSFTKSQIVLSLLVQIFMPLSICFVKISVLILYWQVFYVLKWMRIACITGMTCIIAFQFSLSVAFSAMCAPSTGSSHIDFLTAFMSDTCMHTRALVVLQGVGSVVTDMFLVIIPLPAVLGLQMPLKRKIAVASMFLVGLSACAASIIGLIYRVRFYTVSKDNSRHAIAIWATSMAEEAAAVMICCAPTTATFFKLAKAPVRSWLSRARGRALRLTGWHRSDMPDSGSQSKLKASLESGRNAAYSHLEAREDTAVRVDTEFDAYSLRQMNQTRTSASRGI
ncbi:hypothetical protein INS49_014714 [Diaporthe citri]|uniref:uncharacterized protein n=1 Tax=Diaporthe citri TaxID=83186 RepID=UPI001C7FC142|nr:uncharacterized protein INS49_014714 [Diaporthe citri]KAG6356840.1 hypothetical protein INS49_014714 [Diaporthe citri]